MNRVGPVWVQADGAPVSCREKLKTLIQNLDEARQVMRDTYEDAILMGVDDRAIRRALLDIIDGLQNPGRL